MLIQYMCNNPSIPWGHFLNLQPEDVPWSDAVKNTFLGVRNIIGDFKLLNENILWVFIIVRFYSMNITYIMGNLWSETLEIQRGFLFLLFLQARQLYCTEACIYQQSHHSCHAQRNDRRDAPLIKSVGCIFTNLLQSELLSFYLHFSPSHSGPDTTLGEQLTFS